MCSFQLADLQYTMNMLHFVQVKQTQYILAQTDVIAFAIAAQGSIEFVEPPHAARGLIPYSQLFDELKMKLKNIAVVAGCTQVISSLIPYHQLFCRIHNITALNHYYYYVITLLVAINVVYCGLSCFLFSFPTNLL